MIPIVVIGGFLGCGKTTAVNRLLAQPEGRRIAVIVNDIGDVNIDGALIQAIDGDQITLTNGCICCSLRDDLFTAVTSLVESGRDIDAIIVEASGIANPVTLVMSLKLLEDAAISHAETLVYLVDASNFAQLHFDDAEHVLDNAALCDLLVINKRDLVGERELVELQSRLDEAGVGDNRILSEFGEIPASLLFAPSVVETAPTIGWDRARESALLHHGYRQQTLIHDQPLARQRFDAFLEEVKQFAWRIKGFVRFSEQPEIPYLFNLVGSRATLEPCAAGIAEGLSSTCLVVIGRDAEMPSRMSL